MVINKTNVRNSFDRVEIIVYKNNNALKWYSVHSTVTLQTGQLATFINHGLKHISWWAWPHFGIITLSFLPISSLHIEQCVFSPGIGSKYDIMWTICSMLSPVGIFLLYCSTSRSSSKSRSGISNPSQFAFSSWASSSRILESIARRRISPTTPAIRVYPNKQNITLI